MALASHLIPADTAVTLDGLLRERVKRTPDLVAYREYNEQHGNWRDYTWAQIDHQVGRWQTALVRMLLRECRLAAAPKGNGRLTQGHPAPLQRPMRAERCQPNIRSICIPDLS